MDIYNSGLKTKSMITLHSGHKSGDIYYMEATDTYGNDVRVELYPSDMKTINDTDDWDKED